MLLGLAGIGTPTFESNERMVPADSDPSSKPLRRNSKKRFSEGEAYNEDSEDDGTADQLDDATVRFGPSLIIPSIHVERQTDASRTVNHVGLNYSVNHYCQPGKES